MCSCMLVCDDHVEIRSRRIKHCVLLVQKRNIVQMVYEHVADPLQFSYFIDCFRSRFQARANIRLGPLRLSAWCLDLVIGIDGQN